MKGFALGVALKQRRKATRKSPIYFESPPEWRHLPKLKSFSLSVPDHGPRPLPLQMLLHPGITPYKMNAYNYTKLRKKPHHQAQKNGSMPLEIHLRVCTQCLVFFKQIWHKWPRPTCFRVGFSPGSLPVCLFTAELWINRLSSWAGIPHTYRAFGGLFSMRHCLWNMPPDLAFRVQPSTINSSSALDVSPTN